jgi:TupA-like ATPgrasp
MIRDRFETLAKHALGALPATPAGDALFSSALFYKYHGRWPNLRTPRLWNEHMLRLKLSPSATDPLRQFVTDKEHVKLYVRAAVGEIHNVAMFAVHRSLADAVAYAYPVPCVVKPTHLSGEVIIRRDERAVVDAGTLARWFAARYYPLKREPNYRHLAPKVVVEECVPFGGDDGPDDYKVFCFFGRAQFIQLDEGRFGTHRRRMYARDWTPLPFTLTRAPAEPRAAPPNLEAMVALAERLAAPFEFMRVDLYSDGHRILVGELTSYPGNCASPLIPFEYNEALGSLFTDRDADVRALVQLQSQRGGASRHAPGGTPLAGA